MSSGRTISSIRCIDGLNPQPARVIRTGCNRDVYVAVPLLEAVSRQLVFTTIPLRGGIVASIQMWRSLTRELRLFRLSNALHFLRRYCYFSNRFRPRVQNAKLMKHVIDDRHSITLRRC